MVPYDCRSGPQIPVDAWPLAQWLQHLQAAPAGDERVLKVEVELRGDQFPVPKLVAQLDWAQLFATAAVEFPQVCLSCVCWLVDWLVGLFLFFIVLLLSALPCLCPSSGRAISI